MRTITIPKNLVEKDDLVVIPRKEYEILRDMSNYKEFKPTLAQKKALLRAERNLLKGKTFSYHELIRKLGFTD